LRKGDAPPAAAAVPAVASSALPQLSKLGGGTIDTNGKVTVVNFWATYCVPCIREIPSFSHVNRDYGAKGVLVVGVSMDEDASIVAPFLKKHPMDYSIGLGTPALAQQYGLDALPVTLVFDKAGKLVKRIDKMLSEQDLKAAVDEALSSVS
jgi:thiol-disulfide isomerase/thioredoxin